MSVSAIVKNGEIVKTASQESISASTDSNSVNKDNFLQLLVAQMQYQDPLEPTDNTEWVSQYAQFSQVEELQNMAGSMELTRASSLVGQTVIMNVTGGDGNTTQVEGTVDYVSYEAGKAYLSIDGSLYSMNDLSYVVDEAYKSNVDASNAFIEAMDALPDLEMLTYSDKSSVVAVANMYTNMSDKALDMVGTSYQALYSKYLSKMTELVNANE